MDLESTTSVHLELLSAAPTVEQLAQALTIAHEKPGISVRIPWVEEGGKIPYTLTVRFALEGAEAVWVLKSGLGAHATPVFVYGSGDVSLIYSLIKSQTTGTPEVPPDLLPSSSYTGLPKLSSGSMVTNGEPGPKRVNENAGGLAGSSVAGRKKEFTPPALDRSELRSALPAPSDRNTVFGNNVLVGDLLVNAKLLTLEQLAQAMPIAKKTGLPVGRILVESGVLQEGIVRAAILAQSLIRDKLLHFELAVKALKTVHERDIALGEALNQLGWISEYYEVTNKLGELLVDAGCITPDQLKTAFEVCFASGMPLGRVLVLRKVVPEVVAYTALSAQVQLRESGMTREQAVAAVRNAAQMNTSIQGWMERDGYLGAHKKNTVRLGELIILAGIVSELDLLSAIEAGLSLKSMIGQVLIRTGVISQDLLDQALKLQEAVNSQLLSPAQAAEMLKQAKEGLSESNQNMAESKAAGPDRELESVMQALGSPNSIELKRTLQQLLLERENLAFRLVSEQEEIKHRLARELHDTIIADLMMLKRYLAGDRKLSVNETIEIVDDVVRQLRDICNDFVPKQLQEWGLKATVQDLLERISQRTGLKYTFRCEEDLKMLPEPVLLHIFRIIQECLNNIEKYANASEIQVSVERVEEKILRFVVRDNGQGFDSDAPGKATLNTTGGRGMGGMKERVQLMSCYFPTRMDIQSRPALGSVATLEIKLN